MLFWKPFRDVTTMQNYKVGKFSDGSWLKIAILSTQNIFSLLEVKSKKKKISLKKNIFPTTLVPKLILVYLRKISAFYQIYLSAILLMRSGPDQFSSKELWQKNKNYWPHKDFLFLPQDDDKIKSFHCTYILFSANMLKIM